MWDTMKYFAREMSGKDVYLLVDYAITLKHNIRTAVKERKKEWIMLHGYGIET